MRAYVSLWSADLLDVGRAIDLVAGVADGFHLDVFDGHNVDDLLFGPDFVAAVRRRTTLPLEVHLNVEDPDRWARRFMDVGADIVTVQAHASADIEATLGMIREAGTIAGLGVEVSDNIATAASHASYVDRYLVMGTEIGIKGVSLDPATFARIRSLVDLTNDRPDRLIVIDGGIRAEVIEDLAQAGASGVVPGSLVFGAADPVGVIHQLHALPVAHLTGAAVVTQ